MFRARFPVRLSMIQLPHFSTSLTSFKRLTLTSGFALFLLSLNAASAGAQNPEDEPLVDEDTPAQPAPIQPPPAQPVAPPVLPGDANESVTLTRGQLNDLLRQQAELQRQIDELRRTGATGSGSGTGVGNTGSTNDGTSGSGTAATGSSSGTPASGSNSSLLLPDISFIGNAVGLYSSDRRDEGRSAFRLSEGEIGIQGYVYPGVKADAFIVAAPGEDEAAQFEEGYLTFLGVRPGLNIYAGRKFAPFGRTGEQHPHSWLYSRQLLARRNLVAEENIVGDGVNFRYTRPFGNIYTQADFGIFAGEGAGSLNEFGDGVPLGTGASFTRRFYNSRLYAAIPVGTNGEFAFGASYARGRSELNDGDDEFAGRGNAAISGLDATFRRYLPGGKRLMARAEYFGYRPGRGLPTSKANGYYGLLNYRFNANKDIGLLLERSGFPQAPGQRESATSLIYTKQFTEQFYARLHGVRGRRPGEGSYNEVFLQFVFGLGPHTHSLE